MAKQTTIQLFKNIKTLVEQNRQALYAIANTTLTETYFHIGRLIVENEQHGSNRASYAKETLINLSIRLCTAFGKGFSVDNLENMRRFYIVYKDEYFKYISKNQKSEAPPRKLSLSPFKLSWTNYIKSLKIENKTIGIILCKDKKESTIQYTLGKDNKQVFASKFKMYFPEKEMLKLLK